MRRRHSDDVASVGSAGPQHTTQPDPATVGYPAARRHHHVIFDEDAAWGSLIDNLHVTYARKRSGVGSRLMAEAAAAVIERSGESGLYLWVLEQNTAAQAFYRSRGGRCVEREPVDAPGDQGRLTGTPMKLRYVWPDPAVLLPQR